jgi:hypothetical protein
MAISPDTARRYAQGTAAVVLVVGMFLVSSEAYRTRSVPLGPSETTTTTKSTTERKASAKGTETAEKHETTTASKETVVERALGQAGLWLGRFLLVVLVAFLSGGVVQRILLGEFALKAGPFELPPLPVQLSPVPDIVIEAFRVETTAQDVALGPPEAPVALTSSLVMTLLEQIQAPGPSDYAVIDLGTGRSWLTTRLFLFAVLLRRMRALRTFVFVETREGVAQRFIGVATPELARWRLAREYPWLERALAHAYAEVGDYDIRSDSGALELPAAGRLVDGFMQHPEIQAMESRPVDE